MTSGSKPCECRDLGGSNDAVGWLEIAGQVMSGQGQYHTYLFGPEPYSRPTFCCALPVALHHQNHCSIATENLYLGEAPQTQLSVRSLGQLSLGRSNYFGIQLTKIQLFWDPIDQLQGSIDQDPYLRSCPNNVLPTIYLRDFYKSRWSKRFFVQKSMVRQQEQCFVVAFGWKFSRSPQTVLGSKRVTLANIRSLSTRQTRSGSQKLLRLRSRFSTRSFTPPGTYAPILPGCSASQP